MRTLAVHASRTILMATAALLPGSLTTIAVDDAPEPVSLDLAVLSAGEPVSVDLVVDGQPLRVASTSPRSVTVGTGEPVTVTLADPGPDHVLAASRPC